MISRTKKVLSALVLAGALAMGVAAPAYAESYPPVTPDPGPVVTISGAVVPGGTITATFEPSSFVPGETVELRLTGESASGASLANMVKFAVETASLGTRSSGSDGSVQARIVLPSNASGVYTLTGVSDSQPGGVSRAIQVSAVGGGDPDEIANTGSDGTVLLTAWVGGGLLVLAGGSILVARMVRRNREGV